MNSAFIPQKGKFLPQFIILCIHPTFPNMSMESFIQSPKHQSHLQVFFYYNSFCKVSKNLLKQWQSIQNELSNIADIHFFEFDKIPDEYKTRYQISEQTDSPTLQVFFQSKLITFSIDGLDLDEKVVGFLDVEQWRDNLRLIRDNVERGIYVLKVY